MSDTGKPRVAFLGPEASYTHQVSNSIHVEGCSSASWCGSRGFPKESTRHGMLSLGNYNRLIKTPLRAILDQSHALQIASCNNMYFTRRNIYALTSVRTFTNNISRQLLTPSQPIHMHSRHKLRSRMSSLRYRMAAPIVVSCHSKIAPTALWSLPLTCSPICILDTATSSFAAKHM